MLPVCSKDKIKILYKYIILTLIVNNFFQNVHGAGMLISASTRFNFFPLNLENETLPT